MKTALVTGASRGIGNAIALELKQKGYSVIGTATSQAGVDSLLEKDIEGYILDLNSNDSIDQFWRLLEENNKSISVLVNNAGITRDNIVLRMSDEEWSDIMNVNKVQFNLIEVKTQANLELRTQANLELKLPETPHSNFPLKLPVWKPRCAGGRMYFPDSRQACRTASCAAANRTNDWALKGSRSSKCLVPNPSTWLHPRWPGEISPRRCKTRRWIARSRPLGS